MENVGLPPVIFASPEMTQVIAVMESIFWCHYTRYFFQSNFEINSYIFMEIVLDVR